MRIATRRSIRSALLAVALSVPLVAPAQGGEWTLDPSVLAADGRALLMRAPDEAIDPLFQAVHAAAREPREAAVLCALFEPRADRSLEGFNAAATRLSQASQERLALAVAGLLVAATQHPPQRFDAPAARQALKANAARAAILHDGFADGLAMDGDGADARAARCRALGWMLDTLQQRPLAERALVTRLLLDEGLARLAPAAY
jgi:hypothetical protein